MSSTANPAAEFARKTLDTLRGEDRDLFLYSGGIYPQPANQLVLSVLQRNPRKKNVSLLLTTYGGDAHQAYRLARLFRRLYKSFRVVVFGPCRSAGTLIAVGANALSFGVIGELGPLDVQLPKPDEIVLQSSGLDALEALAMLREAAFDAFESYMVEIVNKSSGRVSTKTACDISAQLVIGLFQPISQQIDPHKLSEVNRMMKIAKDYGERLGTPNLKTGQLDHLIEDYPSHGYIIDHEEAGDIFDKVLAASEAESATAGFHSNEVVTPASPATAKVIDIVSELEKLAETDSNGDQNEADQTNTKRRARRKGNPAPRKRKQEGS